MLAGMREGGIVKGGDSSGPGTPFDAALEAARAALVRRPPATLAARSGGTAVPGGIALSYFGHPLTVSFPGLVASPGLPDMERVLVVRYLAADGDVPDPGDWVSFHQLPGGSFYEPAYRRRATARIVAAFGGAPDRFRAAGLAAGGSPGKFGDVSVLIPAFPRVEAVVVLHRADEEFPADAGVLFRQNVTAFLSLEDVAVLSGVIASRLARAARSLP